MRIWLHHLYSEEKSVYATQSEEILLGRDSACDVVLPSALVADRSLTLRRRQGRWELEVLGVQGCQLERFHLAAGQCAAVQHGSEIRLEPFALRIDLEDERVRSSAVEEAAEAEIAELIRGIHARLLETVTPGDTDLAKQRGGPDLLRFEQVIEELAFEANLGAAARRAVLLRLAGQAVRGWLVDRVIGDAHRRDPLEHSERLWVDLMSASAPREQEFQRIAARVGAAIGVETTRRVDENMDAIESRFWDAWRRVRDLLPETYFYLALREIKKQIKDLVFGYGPIEDLLRLPTITEIMVVAHDEIYVEKRTQGSGGSIERSGRRFFSEASTLSVIERIVQLAGRQIDQSRPMVDARLDDGSRVNAVIAPIAISGPCLTIRKAGQLEFSMDDWRRAGLSEPAARFLQAAIVGRRSLLVAGGTSSGKTTLLSCLAEWIPGRERLVTIEDTAELRLNHDHVVQLQTKHANVENAGEIRIRDLVRNALRMRPDRIIVGECRGAEALDMLQAMNTGHNGSMTTLHANSAAEAIARLEVMVKEAMDLPVDAIHRQIAAAVDLIVEVAHEYDAGLGAKQRRIRGIAEVRDVDPDTGQVDVRYLYELQSTKQGQRLLPTGLLPSFAVELAQHGLFDLDCFFYEVLAETKP